MNLPKIDQPIYEVTLLSREKPVKFRPFLVKEQKIMLMAAEAKEPETTIKAIKQIITNCLLDDVNVDELPLADLETLFINLRARSMGEVLNLYFKCTNRVGEIGLETTCNMVLEVPVNLLTDVKQTDGPPSKKIMLTEEMGVFMKYPSMEMIDNLLKANDVAVMFTVVASCIEKIFDKEEVHETKDASPEEVISFVETLPIDKFELLEKFIEKIPKSHFKTLRKCNKCGFEHEFVLEGLSDFFI